GARHPRTVDVRVARPGRRAGAGCRQSGEPPPDRGTGDRPCTFPGGIPRRRHARSRAGAFHAWRGGVPRRPRRRRRCDRRGCGRLLCRKTRPRCQDRLTQQEHADGNQRTAPGSDRGHGFGRQGPPGDPRSARSQAERRSRAGPPDRRPGGAVCRQPADRARRVDRDARGSAGAAWRARDRSHRQRGHMMGHRVLTPRRVVALAAGLVWMLSAPTATAATVELSFGEGSLAEQTLGLIAAVTLLGLAPGLAIMVTCFPFVVTVLSILRQGLGLQQSPPNMLIVSLAMFLTWFVMEPVFTEAWTRGGEPLVAGSLAPVAALAAAVQPFHDFMAARVDPETFHDLAALRVQEPPPLGEAPFSILVPAFM